MILAVFSTEAEVAQLSAPPSLPLNNEFVPTSASRGHFCPYRAACRRRQRGGGAPTFRPAQ